jgi:hypothetical protein
MLVDHEVEVPRVEPPHREARQQEVEEVVALVAEVADHEVEDVLEVVVEVEVEVVFQVEERVALLLELQGQSFLAVLLFLLSLASQQLELM